MGDKGAHCFGALNDEDQGRGTSGAQVLGVDWRLDPVLVEHLPADVDLEGRVRRVRPHHRPPEVLLSASDQECILYRLRMTCAWQTMRCMKPGFNVHDRSHNAGDSAHVGRGGTQSGHRLEIRAAVLVTLNWGGGERVLIHIFCSQCVVSPPTPRSLHSSRLE